MHLSISGIANVPWNLLAGFRFEFWLENMTAHGKRRQDADQDKRHKKHFFCSRFICARRRQFQDGAQDLFYAICCAMGRPIADFDKS